ncbi:IpaD/SipD/SspD family type III secretion system needle tip protein [uncultured Cedecea sp.]|uniref:IpaD/SipD/SspD family type III secretion system needle tip protein n=1 Tax=uncultured Cedecea sp. TaxID=988762 RepID=UPI00262D700C|nr:IpaD/SipD/SspD family type III secretion system needle tip protein [uncultured Cedecea sp.]
MSSPLEYRPNIEPPILSYDADLKKTPVLSNENIEPSQEKHQDFLKDVIKALSSPKIENTINDIESIIDEYKFNENTHHVKSDKLFNLINALKSNHIQLPESFDGFNNGNKIAKKNSDISDNILNEIRNQKLYRKSASAQFVASPAMLEKEHAADDKITTSMSYGDIWKRMIETIGVIKTDSVDFYADLLHSYTELYASFDKNILTSSAEAVSAGDDGNNVSFDKDKMEKGYDGFKKDLDELSVELGSVPGWEYMTEEQKKQQTAALAPAYKIDKNGQISFDLEQYETVSGTYPTGIKNGKVSTASYQAWLTTINASGNAFQSNMQSFAQRYTNVNNTFDNFIKIFSSSISTLAESARDVFKSL